MTAPSANPALRRKIAAHARPPPDRPDASAAAATGFTRALRHAAAPFEALGLVAGAAMARGDQGLEEALALLPEAGLVAVIEAEGGKRGLVALSPGMVDALVEVQTTGRLDQTDLPPREVTRIDEALARDFVDFTLSAFAGETEAAPGRHWPARTGYGSRVRDRGQITLLLPERPYLVLTAELGFQGVSRRAEVALVLPSGAPVSLAAAVADPGRDRADAAWRRAREVMLDRLPLPLEAVLMRLTRPLSEVNRIAVGDLIPFGADELAAVTLETGTGAAVLRGRLGQAGGRRALRLAGDGPGPRAAPAAVGNAATGPAKAQGAAEPGPPAPG